MKARHVWAVANRGRRADDILMFLVDVNVFAVDENCRWMMHTDKRQIENKEGVLGLLKDVK